MTPLPYLTVPLVVWVVAQLGKFAASSLRGDIDFRMLYRSGGMPSAHTALIVASTTTIGILEGLSSPLFGFALVLSMIIVYDALGVRRATGMQADAIIKLYSLQKTSLDTTIGTARGHTPRQVVAGGILGFALAVLLTYEKSLSQLDWLLEMPRGAELAAWVASTVIVVFLPTIVAYARSWRWRYQAQMQVLLLVLLALMVLSTRSEITPLGYRLFWVVLVALALLGLGTFVHYHSSRTQKGVEVQKSSTRKPKRHQPAKRNKKRH